MTSSSKRRSAPKRPSSREKVRAHRKRLRARGLRPIQFWVPDTRTATFKLEAHHQSRLVAQSRYARPDQDFIDAVSLQPGDYYH
jgi:antidote-toxin recognition MazE-like antitoxin